jgi:hypothetical protein
MASKAGEGLTIACIACVVTRVLKNGKVCVDIIPGRQPVEEKQDTGYQKNAS